MAALRLAAICIRTKAFWLWQRLLFIRLPDPTLSEIVMLFGISETDSTQIEKVSLFYT